MSQHSTIRIALHCFLLCCLACGGCGGDKFTTEASKERGSSRVIALDGAEYLLKTSSATMRAHRSPGLQSLGDINDDGYPDLVVALNRKGASAPSEHTWIEAYSGADGELLWSLQGKYDRDPKIGYRLGPVSVVADFDGDGVRDVYCREAHGKRSAFLISGAAGKIIDRYPLTDKRRPALPAACRDVDSDGVPDLLFSSDSRQFSMVILSGKEFAELEPPKDLWPDADTRKIHWVLPAYHDDNSDGVADCLVRRRTAETDEYAILDGKSFAVLRMFESSRLRVIAKTFFAIVDDLNGDRRGDFVLSSGSGGGLEGRQSLLRAVSGADGTVLWDIEGGQVDGGIEVLSVDARSGEKKSLGRDVGFGNAVTTAPDLDGDSVVDLAVLTDSAASDGNQPAVLIVSGKTGKIASTLAPTSKRVRLMPGSHMIRLRPKSKARSLVLAVYARSSDGDAVVAIIEKAPTP